MIFSSPAEVFLAFAAKKVGVHARVKVRLPIEKKVIGEVRFDKDKVKIEEIPRNPSGLVSTTVGRVIFNDILKPQMAFYDLALSSKHLSRIIADCYQFLGRRETIDLLDRMKDIGFRESTRSGLSLLHRRSAHARQQGADHPRHRKGSREGPEAVPARHHRRGRTLQQGHRRLDHGPRSDHQADDERAASTTSATACRT